jgi:hypothetical protein
MTTKEKAEVVSLIKALRTIKLKQIKNAMFQEDTGCCAMGAWLHVEKGIECRAETDYFLNEMAYDLSGMINVELGLNVTQMNDKEGLTFLEIADKLEEALEEYATRESKGFARLGPWNKEPEKSV